MFERVYFRWRISHKVCHVVWWMSMGPSPQIKRWPEELKAKRRELESLDMDLGVTLRIGH